jgi:DNA helicase-4
MQMYNLDPKQQEAILHENKRLLVLAGAGSGKTKTLIQKLLHLLGQEGAKPSSILAITFTRNAANEMIDRLIIAGDDKGEYAALINNKTITPQQKDKLRQQWLKSKTWLSHLTVKTFHALCYQFLRDSGGISFDNKFRLLSDEDTDEKIDNNKSAAPEKASDIFHKVLMEQCKQVDYLLKLKRYILDFYVDKCHIDKPTQVYPHQVCYTTLRGEKVKSKSERDIADWLYRHNIDYLYEPEVTLKDFPFKPDFFLPQADLYIEHISDKSYKTSDKEKQFELADRNYVKTYEAIMQDSAWFNTQMEKILAGKITDSLSTLTALKYEEEFKSYQDKVADFLKMTRRALSMVKSADIPIAGLLNRSAGHQHERVRVFYELALPIMEGYQQYCKNKSYLDFDDLIIETIHLLEKDADIRRLYQERFKYILVDEFQDVNALQVKLLKLLLIPSTQLFCVGDDWQSIYNFRGSEVDYIVNFEQHFEDSVIVKLDVNYRSTSTIVDASTEVIKHNKFKIDKEIKAHKQLESKIKVYRAQEMDNDGVSYLVEKVSGYLEEGYLADEILILYRRGKMYLPYRKALKEAGLEVTARTIHAAKGLQAKVVFIIGLTDGSGGFPDIWLDDAVFRVIKEVKYDMLMEEERRLFYVALTRAEEQVHLITQFGNESGFLGEIPKAYLDSKIAFKENVPLSPACRICGKELFSSYKFCPSCGTVIQA